MCNATGVCRLYRGPDQVAGFEGESAPCTNCGLWPWGHQENPGECWACGGHGSAWSKGAFEMTTVQAQWVTLAFIVAATAFIIGFDGWITLRYGADASISRVLCRLFGRWPTVAVAVVFWLGLLVGHVWLPAE